MVENQNIKRHSYSGKGPTIFRLGSRQQVIFPWSKKE